MASVLRSWLQSGTFALISASTLSLRAPHAGFKAGSPAPNARISAAPAQIRLWFTERPQVPFSRIQLIGPAGAVALDKIAPDTGNGIHAIVRGTMAAGTYKVVWQTAGADGHPASGEYSFTLADTRDTAMGMAESQRAMPSSPTPSSSAVTYTPSVFERMMRWWEYFAILATLGVLTFIHLVLPPLATRGVQTTGVSAQARGLGEIAVAIYVAAAAYRVTMQMSMLRHAFPEGQGPSLPAVLTGSTWGQGWLLGVIGALLIFAGLLALRRRLAVGTPLALAGALGLVMAPALSGHAASADRFVWAVTFDAMHVAALGAWLGGLLVVVLVGIPSMAKLADGNADAAVSALVNSFHPIALVAAPLAVIAGIGSAVRHVTTFAAISTPYGRVLIVKLGAFAVVAAFAAWNSMRARRRLGTSGGTRSLRRSAVGELLLASVVLAVATVLASTSPPSAP